MQHGVGSLSACARALGRTLVALLALVAGPAAAATPLFTFVQISDSQPGSATDWARFASDLDVIVAGGTPGALLPQPIDFVLIAGDLVSTASSSSSWVQWVNTVNAKLTANGIPYRAIPGNHDQNASLGAGNFELYVADSDPWSVDTATFPGHNGRSVYTGWGGLRIIGFNNSVNGVYGVISDADKANIASKVSAAAAANANIMLLCHHPYNEGGTIPLANVLTNPAIVGYMRGHSGSTQAKKGLSGIANPNIWNLNSQSTQDDGALLYYEVYSGEIKVYVLQLINNPSALPTPSTIALPKPMVPVVQSAPTAAFTASPVFGVAPLAVSFSDTSTGIPATWSWSFGDGGTSTLQNPTHTYASPGIYNVSLTASNALGSNTKTVVGYMTVVPPSPTTTFTPVADARTALSSPNSNYGTSTELRVRAGTSAYQSYLRFVVTGVPSQSVISAKLRLYVTDSSASGGSLHLVDPTWTESGITWTTAPAIGGTAIATKGAVAADQWA
ncbi:MAG TPA: PKD domain-containing protein, partial [Myxococcota bacterium]|nr:PKD domain-containing protein [Myxococcota bacterium]